MGGCYERDYSYSRRETTTPQTSFKTAFKKFLDSHDRFDLYEGYRALLNSGSTKGFIQTIHECVNIKVAPKEINDYEIEAKFNIGLTPRRKGGSFKLESILNALDLPAAPGSLFLKDPVNVVSTGTNHFYGTADGDERLVIIEKGGQTYKKEKGDVKPYDLNLPLQQFILKRHETRIPATPTEIADAMLRLNQDGKMTHAGSLEKTKADFFVINTISGREYGCTVSDARKLPSKKEQQVQFEIEYAGYVPGFPAINIGNERDIVQEMTQLYTTFYMGYGTVETPIDASYIMKLNPTTERKYDFAAGASSQIVGMIPRSLDLVIIK